LFRDARRRSLARTELRAEGTYHPHCCGFLLSGIAASFALVLGHGPILVP